MAIERPDRYDPTNTDVPDAPAPLPVFSQPTNVSIPHRAALRPQADYVEPVNFSSSREHAPDPEPTAREYFDDKGNPKKDVIERMSDRGELPGVPRGNLPYKPSPVGFVARNEVERVMSSIGSVESGGNVTGRLDYGAVGPVCRNGDRAYGAWQVMGNNIAPWAREAGLGNVTKEEFLANPELQQKIVYHQIEKHMKAGYDARDVASIWFTGQPLSVAAHRSDGYNTASQYVAKMERHYNAIGVDTNLALNSNRPNLNSLKSNVSDHGASPSETASKNRLPQHQNSGLAVSVG